MKTDKQESILVPHFEGFKCLGYLVPRAGQYIWVHGESPREVAVDFMDTKLLTYEKLPPKRYIFEDIGEFRKVKIGELYLSKIGTVSRWSSLDPSEFEYTILRKVDEGQN